MKDVHGDAVALRGIIDYLQKSAEPIRTNQLAMNQHIGNPAALRLCKLLEKAGFIVHPIVTRTIVGVPQQVPQLGWTLTDEFERNGCVFDAEAMARRS